MKKIGILKDGTNKEIEVMVTNGYGRWYGWTEVRGKKVDVIDIDLKWRPYYIKCPTCGKNFNHFGLNKRKSGDISIILGHVYYLGYFPKHICSTSIAFNYTKLQAEK